MSIRVVAFDVHNTLLRWPASRVRPYDVQLFLAEYGIDISYQAFEAASAAVFAFDTPKREITCWTDFLALLFGRMEVLIPLDLIVALANRHEARDAMTPLPDAVAGIQAVKALRLTTCTFTTLPEFMLGGQAGEVRRLIDHYFNCSAVGYLKGDRRYYCAITERLGVAPNEILCVGDHPTSDCLIPAEIGWRPVLIDRTGAHAETKAGQIATIRSLTELPGVIASVAP